MTVKSSLSYLSQCDRRVVFGLPDGEKPQRLEIRWPSGKATEMTDVEINRHLVMREP